jgi:hypothetical protein
MLEDVKMASKKNKATRSAKDTNSESSTSTRITIIVAIIGLLGTLGAAYFGYLSARSQVELPILVTRTAEAANTLIAMSAQASVTDLPDTSTPDAISTISQTSTSTPAASPTLTTEDQLIQLIDNYYTCINSAHPDFDNDYETCWNLLSNQPGEFQSHLNKEDFKSFWKQYKVTYTLYYCSGGGEHFVDTEYSLFKRNNLSVPIGKYYLEYSFALDTKGWRIKGGDNSISGIGSYCESQPRIEKLTLSP